MIIVKAAVNEEVQQLKKLDLMEWEWVMCGALMGCKAWNWEVHVFTSTDVSLADQGKELCSLIVQVSCCTI